MFFKFWENGFGTFLNFDLFKFCLFIWQGDNLFLANVVEVKALDEITVEQQEELSQVILINSSF